MSTSGDEFPAWSDDLAKTSDWFDRLRTQALADSGLRINYKRGQGQQVWRTRCGRTLDDLFSPSPIRRAAVAGGELWYWRHWPECLTEWLIEQMHNSTKELWASEDGGTLTTLAFGADRKDVRQAATLRLQQLKRAANLKP